MNGTVCICNSGNKESVGVTKCTVDLAGLTGNPTFRNISLVMLQLLLTIPSEQILLMELAHLQIVIGSVVRRLFSTYLKIGRDIVNC